MDRIGSNSYSATRWVEKAVNLRGVHGTRHVTVARQGLSH